MLTIDQKHFLLQLVRETIRGYFSREPNTVNRPDDELYRQELGAFVTLHKRGNLRGCIGHIEGRMPLFDTIVEMALAAAFQDPRFPPLRVSELEEIDIEISILSPLQRVGIIEEIEVGVHGLLIQRGFASGVLLPQVATEYGWDRLTFLQHTCQKAGLAPDSWMHQGTRIFMFSAEVFGEKDLQRSCGEG